ncbi:hypothetical protein ISF_09584 [Cordyceps fumosorosea ARSEF 2679]|uniref:Uncharacterized protein n=1 Tax=Cordyceps fumosorosea (strain ARSEF 2679) TaxID=1081104 RepID=A0A167FT64_CORFA|nr:hypothetical protein ISF_09584 [Cordyceps fumosorosea ARSEF 2679]OAA45716.1 hypothetical protein ISF_09584 [Cordyceps fumosorosea ARSEF 2679]
MDKLIDYAEEGHKLETHGDVPDPPFVFAATGLMMEAAMIQTRIRQKSLV